MIIGNFTYDAEEDSFFGAITTLTVNRAVHIRPTERSGAREPDYRVISETPVGPVEVGAAWRRTSERGQEFVSVSLDDPAMNGTVNGALFFNAEDASATLVWNRPKAKSSAKEKKTA